MLCLSQLPFQNLYEENKMTSSGEIRVCIIHSRAPNDNNISRKIQQGLLNEGYGKFQVIDYDSNPTHDLSQYNWIVIVCTSDTLNDPKVCKVIDDALNLVTQRA